MKDIYKYIKLPQEERQAHLKLDDPCIERGGQSMYLKGLVAHLRDTTIPDGKKIHVCHACHNAKCSNPDHLYWGTASENRRDAWDNGHNKTIWQLTVDKHGLEEAKKMFGKRDHSKAGRGNKGKPKSEEHKRKLSEAIKEKARKKKQSG
jgi:hypothetical protein